MEVDGQIAACCTPAKNIYLFSNSSLTRTRSLFRILAQGISSTPCLRNVSRSVCTGLGCTVIALTTF